MKQLPEAMRRCWQLGLLRAASACMYIINKGAAAPQQVGFTIRDFVPNFNNFKGRNSQPCPNDLDMKRSSEHMNTTVEVPGEACTDGACAWCRAVLSRGGSRHIWALHGLWAARHQHGTQVAQLGLKKLFSLPPTSPTSDLQPPCYYQPPLSRMNQVLPV